jgi:beta-phosphoglucomutase
MKFIKGLFFDLDGTLVDTLEADFCAYRQALQEVGRKFDQAMYDSIIGLRVEMFLRKLYPDISDEEIQDVREIKARVYPDFLHLIKPNHQLIEFFKTLRPDHVTVLITTARKVNAEAVLKASRLENLFDHTITGDMVTHAKPNPEIYLKALALTGLRPKDVLVFEDSAPGILAATEAGLTVLKITPVSLAA